MTSRVPSGYRIKKVHPAQGQLQRYTLDRSLTFRCSKCQRTSMSSSVVTVSGKWSQLLCSRCYSQMVVPRDASRTKPSKLAAIQVPAKPPALESHRAVSPLPRDMMWLAALHRSIAEGKDLSPSEADLLRRRVGGPATIAARRYAELLLDAEVRLAELSGDARAAEGLCGTRDALALSRGVACRAFEDAHQRALVRAGVRARPGYDGLVAMVIRQVAGDFLEDALAGVLHRRALPANALDRPTVDVWGWLAAHETAERVPLSPEVRRLRQLDTATFVREALSDVSRWQCDEALAHVAVAEQWMACSEEILSELQAARESLETKLTRVSPRTPKDLAALRRAGEAHARGAARCLEAKLIVDDLHVRAAQVHRQKPLQQLRADCLAEAMNEVARADPKLGALVDAACAEHRVECPKAGDPHPYANCAHAVARRGARARLPTDVSRHPRPGVTTANQEASHRALRGGVSDPIRKQQPSPKTDRQLHLRPDARGCFPQEPKPDRRVRRDRVIEPGAETFGFAWVDQGRDAGPGNGTGGERSRPRRAGHLQRGSSDWRHRAQRSRRHPERKSGSRRSARAPDGRGVRAVRQPAVAGDPGAPGSRWPTTAASSPCRRTCARSGTGDPRRRRSWP